MGIGVGLSSIPCILLPFAILKRRGKMPQLHWHVAALPGLLCGAGWELGFIAAVLSTMSPLGESLKPKRKPAGFMLKLYHHTISTAILDGKHALTPLAGLSIGFPMTQCSLLVNGLWSVFFWREICAPKTIKVIPASSFFVFTVPHPFAHLSFPPSEIFLFRCRKTSPYLDLTHLALPLFYSCSSSLLLTRRQVITSGAVGLAYFGSS
jgi:hypothetical protein